MNEFAVGGPEEEAGECAKGELSDSSTVASALGFVDTEGLGMLLVEPLVDAASND